VPWIISECAKIEDMGLEGCLLDHRNRGCAIRVHALIQSLNVREAAALLELRSESSFCPQQLEERKTQEWETR
jgi:hypothetical protein